MAANTTRNLDAAEGTVALFTICAVIWPAGSPEPEKMGSFCPLTRVFMMSMDEMPVWTNALGLDLFTGLRGSPCTGSSSSTYPISPSPSMGFPLPFNILPNKLLPTGIFAMSFSSQTVVLPDLTPMVSSKTCMMQSPSSTSSICPESRCPSASMETSSPKPAPGTFSTKMRGPLTPRTARLPSL